MKDARLPDPLICFGDSLTQGDPHPEADKWTTRLQWLLEQSRPGRCKVYVRGVAGSTTAQGLDRIGEAVLSLPPGRVLVAFGINDCNVRPDRRTPRVAVGEFASNLREIVRMVRAAGGTPLLLAPHYPEPDRRDEQSRKYDQGNGATYAENFRPYHLATCDAAQECGVPLIDMPRLLAGAGACAADLLMPDGVHLTAAGNLFYAEQVYRSLENEA